jgi:hypothetical protein
MDRQIFEVPFIFGQRPLFIGIGRNEARIHRKALATHQPPILRVAFSLDASLCPHLVDVNDVIFS